MVGSAPAMGGAWVAKTVSPCSELRLDHTKAEAHRKSQSVGHPRLSKGDERAWKDGTEVTR